MLVIIEKLGTLGGKPIETLEAQETRLQPTPTDAVTAVIQDFKLPSAPARCDTIENDIPITRGTTPIRIYTPTGEARWKKVRDIRRDYPTAT